MTSLAPDSVKSTGAVGIALEAFAYIIIIMEISIFYFAFELTFDSYFCSATCLVFAFLFFLSPLCTLAQTPC
jgi:hypothetical protein